MVEDVAQALVAAVDVAEIEGESFNLVAETDLTAFDYLKALEARLLPFFGVFRR